MGLIAVEGMRFYAYHGFYNEEQKIGGDYLVDVYVHTNFKKAAREDALSGTINYESIYIATRIEMNKPTRLLETIATRIMNSLKNKFSTIQEIKVRISKLHPPIGGETARTFIEVGKNHRIKCAKTGDKMLCYDDHNCWCKELLIHEETRKMLDEKYDGCLNPEVLEPYAAPNTNIN